MLQMKLKVLTTQFWNLPAASQPSVVWCVQEHEGRGHLSRDLRHGALAVGDFLVSGLRHVLCAPHTLTQGREIPRHVSGSRSAAIDDS